MSSCPIVTRLKIGQVLSSDFYFPIRRQPARNDSCRFTTASWSPLYPFDASRTIDIRGLKMHYLDAGPSLLKKGAGPLETSLGQEEVEGSERVSPLFQQAASAVNQVDRENAGTILCVHGNPTWSFYYRRVVEQFAGDHRVVAVDHLGCGLSDKPTANEYPYSFAARRDDLVELIERLDLQRITLLAHDWGGAIGLAAAAKVIKRMRGIVLLNTAGFPPPLCPLAHRHPAHAAAG